MGATYRVLNGIDYSGKRAEPGDLVSDLPTKSVSWLVEQGHVELAKDDGDVPEAAAPTEDGE